MLTDQGERPFRAQPANACSRRTRLARLANSSGRQTRGQPIESWSDVEGTPLEVCLGDIAVAIVVHGERVCRSSAQHHREWVIKRKEEIAAEERRKEAERRRLERQRLERLEKTRVGRLLEQARSLREAEEIRAYVSAVRERQSALDDPLSGSGFQQWADWALAQADRIDPVLSGGFRTVQDDD